MRVIIENNKVTRYVSDGDNECIIPDGVTEICDGAFKDCLFLKSVTIPGSVNKIGKYAFYGCTRLEIITIPENVEIIGDSAFENCTKLTNATISYGVKIIGDSAFSGCSKLTNIKIPNSVKAIGNRAFKNCTNLVNADIPESIKEIGLNVFYGCNNLNNKKVSSTTDIKIMTDSTTSSLPSISEFNYIMREMQKHMNNLKKLEINPLDIENNMSIEKFGEELKDYPMIISSTFYSSQRLDKNDETRIIRLNKILDKITTGDKQSLFEKIGNMFLKVKDGEIVLNKDEMRQLRTFSDSETDYLRKQTQILEDLKEMSKLYVEKLKRCKQELNTIIVSNEKDEFEDSDITSLNNSVQVKMKSLDTQLFNITIMYNQINNAINLNITYIESLKEVTTVLLPSIISDAAYDKIVIRKQESVTALKEVADILKQIQNKPEETNGLPNTLLESNNQNDLDKDILNNSHKSI